MKINIVLGHALEFPPTKGGGIENLYLLLSRQFAKLGHEVVVYSRASAGLPDAETDADNVRHVRLGGFDWSGKSAVNAINSFRWCLRLRQKMESADVSFFNTLFSFLLLHRPCYGVAASTIHRTPKARIRFFRRFDRIYAGSDAVVEQARRAAPKLANLKRIYNCTDLPDHCPPPPKKVGGEGLLFTYVGRFVPDKGLEHLIKGFAEALRDWPRNRLLTIGPQTDTEGADSAFFARMQSYVKEHRLENSITLHPPIYERELLMRELAQADVVCVPTITGETFSMAILEAMSLARPILTSDFGPMPEAVEHLTTGFVSKVADSESICEGIKYFSSNVSRLSEMGRNAYEKATKEFSPEKIAKEYIQDITDLINNRSK